MVDKVDAKFDSHPTILHTPTKVCPPFHTLQKHAFLVKVFMQVILMLKKYSKCSSSWTLSLSLSLSLSHTHTYTCMYVSKCPHFSFFLFFFPHENNLNLNLLLFY